MTFTANHLASFLLLISIVSEVGIHYVHAAELELSIDPTHQACEVDADCSLIYDRCDSCSCGVGVNRKYKTSYVGMLERMCWNYKGPHCARICAPLGLRCVDSRCEVSFAGENAR